MVYLPKVEGLHKVRKDSLCDHMFGVNEGLIIKIVDEVIHQKPDRPVCYCAPPRWRCCLLGRTSTEVPSWWTFPRPWATRPEFRPVGRDCSTRETWPTNPHTLTFTLQVKQTESELLEFSQCKTLTAQEEKCQRSKVGLRTVDSLKQTRTRTTQEPLTELKWTLWGPISGLVGNC